MAKKFRAEELDANRAFIREKIDGPSDCGVPEAEISGLKVCDINLHGHISGHVTGDFEEITIKGQSVLSSQPQFLYGFWFSGCNTENLYLDIGEKEETGWDDHIHHGSGYRAWTIDFSGVDVHINGRNEYGLLTFEYPEV